MKKAYLITAIEPELLRNFKSACAHYGLSMRQSFVNHMESIVNARDFDKLSKDDTKHKSKKGGKKK